MNLPANIRRCEMNFSTNSTINALKTADEDFEWYPTTNEMIDIIAADIKTHTLNKEFFSVLDCGAGDGRVLMALTKGKRYAIEKSNVLRQRMHKDIFIVGTNFDHQSLIDKRVDVLFTNPPYSLFSDWMLRCIKEANSSLLYLIVPSRWQDNDEIKQAIIARRGTYSVLQATDFLSADRKARAKVDIVRVKLGSLCHGRSINKSPFSLWFSSYFNIAAKTERGSKYDTAECRKIRFERDQKTKLKDAMQGQLVSGSCYVDFLENIYNSEMQRLLKNYKALEELDSELLEEMNVDLASLEESLEFKISGLKCVFWQVLIDNMESIVSRLCAKPRKAVIDEVMANVHVDFTASNAYAIVLWLLDHANEYIDLQLIDFVHALTQRANVIKYKSNQRTLDQEKWRYLQSEKKYGDIGEYHLDYRIVIDSCYSGTQADLVNDLLAVAYNLGFDTMSEPRIRGAQIEPGELICVHYKTMDGCQVELAKFRFYKNSNAHIRLNQKFLCKLNVEFGRLNGWIKSPRDAVNEMDISEEDAVSSYGANILIGQHQVPALEFMQN